MLNIAEIRFVIENYMESLNNDTNFRPHNFCLVKWFLIVELNWFLRQPEYVYF